MAKVLSPRFGLAQTLRLAGSRIVACAAAFAALAATPPAAQADVSKPFGHVLAADQALWQAYNAQFVMPDGRVIDNVNGGISHSESQGYGMLLAVAAGDKATFERIWGFTERTLFIRDDGLAAWKFEPGPVETASNAPANEAGAQAAGRITDMNNATDGDLLIAWALAEASAAGFGDQYTARASLITKALRTTVYNLPPFGVQIMPGKVGFSAAERDGLPVINPSYWVFPAFDRLNTLLPDPMWNQLNASGLSHVEAAKGFPASLLPDWVALDTATGKLSSAPGFDDGYSYNNIRIPLYLAMTGSSSRRNLRAAFEHWFQIEGPLRTIGVNDRSMRDELVDPGYESIRSLYNCATRNIDIPEGMTASLDTNYYPATLQLLALAAARRSYERCL
jgi:endoglucanase